MTRKLLTFLVVFIVLNLWACSMSYTFQQSTINYDVIKTIRIADFPNQATLISPTLSSVLSESIRDKFTRSTRLEMVNGNADLELEGEITGYALTPMAVREDAYSAETKLTITIRVRYFNNVDPDKSIEQGQSISAYTTFDSNEMLTNIQTQLDEEIISELVDQIYNLTVGDW